MSVIAATPFKAIPHLNPLPLLGIMSQYFSIMRNAYNLLLFAPHNQRAPPPIAGPTKRQNQHHQQQQMAQSPEWRLQRATAKVRASTKASAVAIVQITPSLTPINFRAAHGVGCDPPDWEVSALPRSQSVSILVGDRAPNAALHIIRCGLPLWCKDQITLWPHTQPGRPFGR